MRRLKRRRVEKSCESLAELTIQQLAAIRLCRLTALNEDERAMASPLSVVSQLVGVQAQSLVDCGRAIAVRVAKSAEFNDNTFESLLLKQRKLARTWSFRGTLHLHQPKDLPSLTAAFSTLYPTERYTKLGILPKETQVHKAIEFLQCCPESCTTRTNLSKHVFGEDGAEVLDKQLNTMATRALVLHLVSKSGIATVPTLKTVALNRTWFGSASWQAAPVDREKAAAAEEGALQHSASRLPGIIARALPENR